jgi:outer membrane cobalamin receptor
MHAEGDSMPRCFSVRTRSILRSSCLVLFTVALAAGSAFADTLRGRVVDSQQRPVAAADVIVLRGASVVTTIKTQADGRFGPVTLPAGDYRVIASAPGLRSAPQPATVSPTGLDVEITLTPSAFTDSVVVSAAHVETPLSRVTDSVTVISGADLAARQADTVADAMRLVPGFGVVSSGGRGALTSFFPRGGESDYTLVLVDGIPQNAFGGGFDAAHLTTADIDRIEVVRGPQSALYGGGAIGGIVHVLTRHGGPLRANGLFEAGSQGTWHTNASAAGSNRAWTWGGSVDWLTTDGDTRVFPSVGGKISNDDYDRTAGSGSLGWSDRPDRSVRIDVRGGRNERGNPGPFGADPFGRYGGLDTVSRGRNISAEVGVSAAFGSARTLRHEAQFTWADLKSHFESGFGPSDDRSRRVTGRYQADIEREHLGLTAGVEALHEQDDNTFITGATFQPVPIERSVTGLFVEARPAMGDRAFLTTGVRLERIARRALEGDGFSRPAFGDDVVWSANPKLSAAWFVRPPGTGAKTGFGAGWTKIRGGVGTGIKPPTGFEVAFTDNPSLKPERSRSVDVGVEQALAGSALVVDLTWFANRYDDLIVSIGTALSGASRYRTDNIANARARGLELGVNANVRAGVSVRAAWTWLDTEILGVDGLPTKTAAPFVVGGRLIRRPAQQGSIALTWTADSAGAFLVVNGRGRMTDLEPNFGTPVFPSAGYVTVSLGGALRVARQIEIIGRVSNAFNRAYEEALGFPALGRSALVGVRVTAGR